MPGVHNNVLVSDVNGTSPPIVPENYHDDGTILCHSVW